MTRRGAAAEAFRRGESRSSGLSVAGRYNGAIELGKKRKSDEETLTRSPSFQLGDVTRLCASGDAGGKAFQSGLPEAAGLLRADCVRRRPSSLPHIHFLGKHLCHCWSGTLGVEAEEAAANSYAGRADGSCCRRGEWCAGQPSPMFPQVLFAAPPVFVLYMCYNASVT